MARPRELPERARIVIIGGGVGGASIAYHLPGLGEKDVVLLDRNELTSGSTFHSAGLVGQLRSSVTLTEMMMYSAELYRTLEEEAELIAASKMAIEEPPPSFTAAGSAAAKVIASSTIQPMMPLQKTERQTP
ncbi:MAG: FAD-dependent oxidoreductase, partial [Solirubrobacterales bacterium]